MCVGIHGMFVDMVRWQITQFLPPSNSGGGVMGVAGGELMEGKWGMMGYVKYSNQSKTNLTKKITSEYHNKCHNEPPQNHVC